MGVMCRGRKRWILSVPVKGTLLMDEGAVRAVIERSKSLFSAGIVGVSGDFNAQDAVQLCDADGTELGRGLCNYSAAEVDRIKVTPIPGTCFDLHEMCLGVTPDSVLGVIGPPSPYRLGVCMCFSHASTPSTGVLCFQGCLSFHGMAGCSYCGM